MRTLENLLYDGTHETQTEQLREFGDFVVAYTPHLLVTLKDSAE